MWHVSIAFLKEPEGTLAFARWGPSLLARARDVGLHLLLGVGEGSTWIHRGNIAIHVRRSLTDAEIAKSHDACPAFRDSEPVDASGGELLEVIP